MAGRSRKTTIIKDIEEEKGAVETKPETVEVKEVKPRVRTATVKADPWLNVRNKPSANSDVIGKLYTGDSVTIYEEKDGFGKISILENKWVKLDFVF